MFEEYNTAFIFQKDALEDFLKMVIGKGYVPVAYTSDRKLCQDIENKVQNGQKVEYIVVVHILNPNIND